MSAPHFPHPHQRRAQTALANHRAPSSDLDLWRRATGHARAHSRIIPGLAEVVEKVGPCAPHGDITVYFSTSITPDHHGEPMARLIESAGRRTETAFEPLVRHAHALLDLVENALQSADPLLGTNTGGIRRSMQRVVEGRSCIGFQAARRTAGLDLEFSVWVDAQTGHAARVDFRGINLHDTASDSRISSVYGMRRYETDPFGRSLLRCQTDRLTFVTVDPELPSTGYAERTSSYNEHWEQPPAAALLALETDAALSR
ncbi:MAG TPA: hypothetical protein VK178_00295 [Opitutaceae bacterium]|nr:hypothetical protein [Opitutaceae bacterium]